MLHVAWVSWNGLRPAADTQRWAHLIDYGDGRHWTCGDRGVSEWTIRGTQVTGESIEARGCDLFEFTDGKISRKDSFWKIVD
jgi:ketosteroid isomerase-like protein